MKYTVHYVKLILKIVLKLLNNQAENKSTKINQLHQIARVNFIKCGHLYIQLEAIISGEMKNSSKPGGRSPYSN